MRGIDSQQTSNDYSNACTLSDVYNSNGGYFAIDVAGVYMSLQWGQLGTLQWTNDVHVPVGNGVLQPGTTGIRFKSYVAGSPATVSAALAAQDEPAITIGTPATATVTGALTGVTGLIAANGTITAGTGFTVAKGTAGIYTITFTTPFAVTPTITGSVLTGLGRTFTYSSPLPGSFVAVIRDSGDNVFDCAFDFVAIATV